MVKGIEHIAILSPDSSKLKDWYINSFDFKVVYDNQKGTYFLKTIDGSMIEIIQQGAPAGEFNLSTGGIRHIAFTVDEFEKVVEGLKAQGVTVVAEPLTTPTGIKTFFFKDLDGNILHLISRPYPL